MRWTLSVVACRCLGTQLQTTSFVVEGDSKEARCLPGRCVSGLVEAVRSAQRMIGLEGAIVEVGIANDEPYTLAMHHGCVLRLVPSLTIDSFAQLSRHASASAAVVLGPSAVLEIGEELLQSTAPRRATSVDVSPNEQSPYPPHRSPLGTTPIGALLANPTRWCRPFAALDDDYRLSLIVTSRYRAEADPTMVTIDALTPLLAFDDGMHWRATLSNGDMYHIHADLNALVDAIVGAVGELAPAVLDDSVSGERFGLAQPMLTSIRLTDLGEREQ